MLTQLFQATADREAGQVFSFDHQQRNALGAGVTGTHHHHQQVGGKAIGDEGLGAIDDIVIVHKLGARANGFEIGAAARFGHGDAGQHLATGELGQPLLFLLFGAIVEDVVRSDRVHRSVERHFSLGQFVLHHQLVSQARSRPAILFGQLGQHETHFAERTPCFAWDIALIAPAFKVGHEFGVDKAANLFAEGRDVGVHPGVLVKLRQHSQAPVTVHRSRRRRRRPDRRRSQTQGCTA